MDSPIEPVLADADALDAVADAGPDDDRLAGAYEALLEDAEAALDAGPFSVTYKDECPPSGDYHDYLSQGRYWWPNPDTEDGLPYVRRDGESNPEINNLDRPQLGGLVDAVDALGLAYRLTDRERYAERAATLLRTWFLDAETRMNPHLRYGQRVPGRHEGRCYGIIDTRGFRNVVDAVAFVADADVLGSDEIDRLCDWFADYLRWLLTDDLGREEAARPNNHGTWFDVQSLSLATFLGQDLPNAALDECHLAERRLQTQFADDGSQPEEVRRTRPLHYSAFNLRAHLELARLADRYGVDLWSYESVDGVGLRNGVDWVAAEIDDEGWTRADDGTDTISFEHVGVVLRLAAVGYGEDRYREMLEGLPVDVDRFRFQLRHPPVAVR